jgi:hypothetical protein
VIRKYAHEGVAVPRGFKHRFASLMGSLGAAAGASAGKDLVSGELAAQAAPPSGRLIIGCRPYGFWLGSYHDRG